jgi:hypothetical protein
LVHIFSCYLFWEIREMRREYCPKTTKEGDCFSCTSGRNSSNGHWVWVKIVIPLGKKLPKTHTHTHTHTLWDVGSKETGVQFWKLNFWSADDLHYAEFTKSLL